MNIIRKFENKRKAIIILTITVLIGKEKAIKRLHSY